MQQQQQYHSSPQPQYQGTPQPQYQGSPQPQAGYAAPQQQPVYSQQPGAGVTGPQQWQNDLFGCCSPAGTCCTGFWCPCVLYGKTKARERDGTLKTYSACNGSCWAFCGLMCCGVQWILQTLHRGDIRAKYNLPGSTATDLLLSCFCGCCQLIQEDKEVERLTKPAANAGYQAQGQMKYPQ